MPGIAIAIVLAFLAILAFKLFFSDGATIRRALREAPPTTIGQAPEGQVVRLHGRVAATETLIAPLTGRPCVFYVVTIEERVSHGKSSSWRSRVSERKGVPFAIEDGTGRALVDPTRAQLDVEIDSTSKSGAFDDATPAEAAFLARHGMDNKSWFFNNTMRYREGVIEPGETVAIAARALREPDPDAVGTSGGYRGGPATRLRLGGTPEAPVLISDSPDLTREG